MATVIRKKKVPKKKNDHPLFKLNEIYNVHSTEPITDDGDGWQYGCFIDIGIRNMAVRFSRACPGTQAIEGLSQSKYDFDLSKRTKKEKAILAQKCQIAIENDKFAQLLHRFTLMKEDLSNCHYIVIEQQIGSAPFNVRVMNYTIGVIASVVCNSGRRPIIVEIDATQKSIPLGAPRGMSYSNLKDWCYYKSLELLQLNGGIFDLSLKEQMESMCKSGINKRDDPADTICYCYVWWTQYVFPGIVSKPCLSKSNERIN